MLNYNNVVLNIRAKMPSQLIFHFCMVFILQSISYPSAHQFHSNVCFKPQIMLTSPANSIQNVNTDPILIRRTTRNIIMAWLELGV